MQLTEEQKASIAASKKAGEKGAGAKPKTTARSGKSKQSALSVVQTKTVDVLVTEQKALADLSAGMETFSDDFSDRFVEIVEDGLTAGWEKAGEKLAEIVAPDFFGGERESLFALRPMKMLSGLSPSRSDLPASQQTLNVTAN